MQLIHLFACLPLIHLRGKEAFLATGKETQFSLRALLDRAPIHKSRYMSEQARSNIWDQKTKRRRHRQNLRSGESPEEVSQRKTSFFSYRNKQKSCYKHNNEHLRRLISGVYSTKPYPTRNSLVEREERCTAVTLPPSPLHEASAN